MPCLVAEPSTFTSECVIKVPDAQPEQLGFLVAFLPTAVPTGKGLGLGLPRRRQPARPGYGAFAGDLGLKHGRPQSVYELDPASLKKMKPLVMKADPLAVGKSLDLPERHGLDRVHRGQGVDRPSRSPTTRAGCPRSLAAIAGRRRPRAVPDRPPPQGVGAVVSPATATGRDRQGGASPAVAKSPKPAPSRRGGRSHATEGGDFSEEFAEIV